MTAPAWMTAAEAAAFERGTTAADAAGAGVVHHTPAQPIVLDLILPEVLGVKRRGDRDDREHQSRSPSCPALRLRHLPCSLRGCGVQRDRRGIAPQPFQLVVLAQRRMKDMDDSVRVVEQRPSSL